MRRDARAKRQAALPAVDSGSPIRVYTAPCPERQQHAIGTRIARTAAFAIALVLGGTPCACGESTEKDPPGDGAEDAGAEETEPGGPVFLSFGTNVNSIGPDDAVTFTAVLTDPDGIDDVIGGSLKASSSDVTFGAFATTGQEGAYSLTLSWDQIHQSTPIEFESPLSRDFVAEFFDVAGHKAIKSVAIAFDCPTGAACDGYCVDLMSTAQHCGGCNQMCDGCAGGVCFNLSQCVDGDAYEDCDEVCGTLGQSCAQECLLGIQDPAVAVSFNPGNDCSDLSDREGRLNSCTSGNEFGEGLKIRCCCSSP